MSAGYLRDADGNVLQQWLNDPVRQFTLQIYLFDGLSGELVDQGTYQSRAAWSFDKQEQVDVTGQPFFGTPPMARRLAPNWIA